VIRCNAQVAQRMLAEPQRLKEVDLALEDIEEATRRASDVLERLRLFLRRNDAPFERLDLNGVTGEVVSLARRELAPRGVSIAFRPAARLPQVNGGRMQLQQAIWHLVLNAAEAISGNDPGDRHITVATGAADGSLQVAVSDRGAGIPPELLHRVFEPFFTSKPQGIGLGLSICRSIVIAHGGEVWAANNPDRGATVCFTVPPATDAPVRAREHGSGTTG
jgi:signal transduction histidine kinase